MDPGSIVFVLRLAGRSPARTTGGLLAACMTLHAWTEAGGGSISIQPAKIRPLGSGIQASATATRTWPRRGHTTRIPVASLQDSEILRGPDVPGVIMIDEILIQQ